MNRSRIMMNQWRKLWEEYSVPDYGHAARPYCESNCELAHIYTYLAYGGLLGKDGVWAFSLSVPGQELNDTAEAARVAGALREDRGLCCSCATLHVACKQHWPSLRGTLVEFVCTHPTLRSSWYPGYCGIRGCEWTQEMEDWREES